MFFLKKTPSQPAQEMPNVQEKNKEVIEREVFGYRKLGKAHFQGLLKEVCAPLGLNIIENELHYLVKKINFVEQRCYGRFASNIQDIIFSCLLAKSLMHEKKQINILEIGTLFGIRLCAMHVCNRFFFDNVNCKAIDPLDGYYASGPDKGTGLPVSRNVVLENFRVSEIHPSNYKIIQRYSTDKTVEEELAGEMYDICIIDGDHSYDGVKNDFYLVINRVNRGGYILFDDYNNKTVWPGVTRFIEETDFEKYGLEKAAAFSNTIAFKKIS
ncbi:MAG: class I SAM-dependent methyltransferase [Desulfovibrionaceae bacterium]|nr:class I SAM-dependent methyltransferase [Desulfovibrionaceae bacterium]